MIDYNLHNRRLGNLLALIGLGVAAINTRQTLEQTKDSKPNSDETAKIVIEAKNPTVTTNIDKIEQEKPGTAGGPNGSKAVEEAGALLGLGIMGVGIGISAISSNKARSHSFIARANQEAIQKATERGGREV